MRRATGVAQAEGDAGCAAGWLFEGDDDGALLVGGGDFAVFAINKDLDFAFVFEVEQIAAGGAGDGGAGEDCPGVVFDVAEGACFVGEVELGQFALADDDGALDVGAFDVGDAPRGEALDGAAPAASVRRLSGELPVESGLQKAKPRSRPTASTPRAMTSRRPIPLIALIQSHSAA